ncbi:MAG: M23 family metallopeptidase [Wolbachia endosymbiont of Tyrophagus putrescentiae]|nr:M23 family metallopeptidase [Wolbachia endosymbiont of Tyrophagus putrescentiae]
MWRFFLLCITVVGCGLQKPALVLLKGEEFYGRRDLENIQEYRLIKNDVVVKDKNKKITIKIYKNTQNSEHKFIMPIRGEVVSKFKSKTADEVCKDGIKIISYNGSNVLASAHGKVIYVGKGVRWYGNLIVMEHEDSYITAYSYLKDIDVGIGDEVHQGQVIGSAGKSSTQDRNPQICFTMRNNGKAVDPLLHMN